MNLVLEYLSCAFPVTEQKTSVDTDNTRIDAGYFFALRNISLTLPAGALLCVCGCNGSGKSTLLQTLAGIHVPHSGQVFWQDGEGTMGIRQDSSAYLREHSALLLQDADMQIIGSTVAEDLLLPWVKPTTEQLSQARYFAKQFGLLHLWDTPVQQLSYGQRRKVCLVAALLTQPQLILYDEPLSGLDYPSILALEQWLLHAKEQRTTQIVSTHDMEPFLKHATHMLLLHEGQQQFFGPSQEALQVLAESIQENPSVTGGPWGIRLPQGVAPD